MIDVSVSAVMCKVVMVPVSVSSWGGTVYATLKTSVTAQPHQSSPAQKVSHRYWVLKIMAGIAKHNYLR